MVKNNLVIADKNMEQAIRDGLEDAGYLEIENAIIIQSPLFIQSQKENRWHDTLVEVFPLWLEYYMHFGKLSNPWKIIVAGIETQYQDLPYYVTPFQEEMILGGIGKLLKTETIDYSQIPGTCSGKDYISAFFHGHGEENIKGLLGKITDYIRNGILMIREGAAIEEVKEIFFTHAAAHLEQLQSRLGKYRPLLEYLPWEQEIEQLDKMIITVESWLKQPNESVISHDEILNHVKMAFESISQLMKIHKIVEKK
ncbi:MAG: hypothetical protein NT166_04580 [Candidatus Aminicenantes bacterium]|nr:hypothetical protein [Candidatus Aminicenantes bacterium]